MTAAPSSPSDDPQPTSTSDISTARRTRLATAYSRGEVLGQGGQGLEAAGPVVYGYGSDFASREPRFLTSVDGGASWRTLTAPEPLISLAIAPDNARELVASGESGLHRSGDAGKSWEPVEAPGPGHVVWTDDGVVLIDLDGRVHHERDRGRWRPAGSIGGQTAAFDQGAEGELLAARHDGVVVASTDGGKRWDVRSAPG